MPFGAHETMETHEILMEKINAITHFNLYASQAKNPQLLEMIVRHQQEEIQSYNEIVALTRGSSRFVPIPSNTPIRNVSHQQIQYGLNNPPQMAPQSDATMNDSEIAIAMLLCHKNGARNCTWASLECADPNLRRTLFNCAATCNNQAYEVFLFMNQQGVYQVPTLNTQTQETFLHSYQPAGEALQAQYGVPAGQMGTTMGVSAYMAGTGANATTGSFSAGSADSVLYGGGTGGSAMQVGSGGTAMQYGGGGAAMQYGGGGGAMQYGGGGAAMQYGTGGSAMQYGSGGTSAQFSAGFPTINVGGMTQGQMRQ